MYRDTFYFPCQGRFWFRLASAVLILCYTKLHLEVCNHKGWPIEGFCQNLPKPLVSSTMFTTLQHVCFISIPLFSDTGIVVDMSTLEVFFKKSQTVP